MKREQIIKKIETLAGLFYGKRVEVHTCRDIYPKCYLVVLGIHGEAVQHLTDPMLPTKLLARGYQGTLRYVHEIEL